MLDDGGTSKTDAGAADGGNGGHLDAGGKAQRTTFVLDNAGVAPMIVGNQCGGLWLSLQRGNDPVLVDRSCSCPCDDTDFCGCPAICRITERLLVPGRGDTVEWDGVAAKQDAGKGCYTTSVPSSGEPLVAKACWNENDQSGARSCTSETFAYAEESEVHIVAKTAALEPTETKLELVNETGGAIELVVNHCGAQGYFEVESVEERLSVSTFCPCPCDESFGLDVCPVCGACGDDVRETLAMGASKAFGWDGKFWYTYESSCQMRYDMPENVMLEAKVCWLKPGQATPQCTATSFLHGQTETVQLVAQ